MTAFLAACRTLRARRYCRREGHATIVSELRVVRCVRCAAFWTV